MKNIIAPVCLFFAGLVNGYGQNTPTPGSGTSVATVIPGTITNIVTPPSAYSLGSTPVFNYTQTFVPQYAVSNAASIDGTTAPGLMKMNVVYTDGFARKMEEIVRYNSAGKNLITPYDNRPSTNKFSYSPYSFAPTSSSDKAFHISPFSEQSSFYSTLFPSESGAAMTETSYFSDAASRSTFTYAPGKSNIGQFNGVQNTSNTNVSNEVVMWKVIASPTSSDPLATMPQKVGFYSPGVLTKKITATADGGYVEEFFDNENKLVCKNSRTYYGDCSGSTTGGGSGSLARSNQPSSHNLLGAPAGSGTTPTCSTFSKTYYVYDQYERLTYTLHPNAVNYLVAHSWLPTTAIINDLCDFVVYDERGRIIEKHLAGENGNEQQVYDTHNRLVLFAKPNDVTGGNWWWNHYDALDRIIETGSIANASSRTTLQGWFDNLTLPTAYNTPSSIFYFLYNDAMQGIYPNTSFPSTVVYSYNFYDDYNSGGYFDGTVFQNFSLAYDASIFTGNIVLGTQFVSPPSTQSRKTQGRLTYSVARVIKPYALPTIPDYISTGYYYDDNGRLIQTISKNIHNGTNKTGFQYDFKGRLVSKICKYNNPACTSKPNTSILTRYTYESQTMNLISVSQSLDGLASVPIAVNTYDNLNQAITKNIGDGVEWQSYTYNIRKQITGINPNYAENGVDGGLAISFGESIKYDAGFTHNLFCGGISGIIWKDKGMPSQSYGYTYDNANRLIQSDFREYSGGGILVGYDPITHAPITTSNTWNKTATDYTEGSIKYDANGNILSLVRYGPFNHVTSIAPDKIDNLTYTYEAGGYSNHLQAASDAVPALLTNTLTDYDFKYALPAASVDYTYDANGNLATDRNKKTSTSYNYYNNKPLVVSFNGSSDQIYYIYDAAGNKLEEHYYISGVNNAVDYDDNILYKNNQPYQINNQEGYAVLSSAAGTPIVYSYFYLIKDHLGNVREVLNATPYTSISGGGTTTTTAGVTVYKATHELSAATTEQSVFDNIPAVRESKPGATSPGDTKTAQLDAAYLRKTIGTTLVLKVMAGDTLDISGQSFYPSSAKNRGTISNLQLFISLMSTLVTGGGGGLSNSDINHASDLAKIFSPDNISIYNSLRDNDIDPKIPQAFINYIFYDENFKIISKDCGKIQIGHSADIWNTIAESGISVNHPGYVAVYLSTQTIGIPVSIDLLTVTHYHGAIQDVNHYYPYGLAVNLATTLNAPGLPSNPANPIENTYLYQTKKQDKTKRLYLDDFGARRYDPQLGRFLSIDAHNQFPSGYVGMGDNPVSGIDPTGNDDISENDESAEENEMPEPAPPPSDFYDKAGHKKFHVDDGSNAVYQEKGSGTDIHYGLIGFDETQGGLNRVNITTAIYAAQQLNLENPDLRPNNGTTYCNYATQNILKTVASATNNSFGLAFTGTANMMYNSFLSSNLLSSVTVNEALNNACLGGLSLYSYLGTTHGHVGTFSVGENINRGQTANVGLVNGFMPIGPGSNSVFYGQEKFDQTKFYILNPTITPVSAPQIIPFYDFKSLRK